jgi:hypothetical protein
MTHEPKRARKGREGTKIILLVACSRDKKPYFHGITTTDWFITIATFTVVATTDGLTLDAAMVLRLHLLRRMKSWAD